MTRDINETYEVSIDRNPKTQHKTFEIWRDLDGRLHRPDDLPAATLYNSENGVAERTEYWQCGLRHRTCGPAIVEFDAETGNVLKEEYYMYGQRVSGTPRNGAPKP